MKKRSAKKIEHMIFEQFVDIPNVDYLIYLKKDVSFYFGLFDKKMNHSDNEQPVLLLKSTQ